MDLIFDKQIGLACGRKVDPRAKGAKRRKPQLIVSVDHQITLRYRIDTCQNRAGAQPVHDFIFITKSRCRMRRSLRNHEDRG